MEPVHEPDFGPQAMSGRDRRLEGGPALPRIVSGKDGIAVRVQPVGVIEEGKPERNAAEIVWQLAFGLPMITAVATGDRCAVSHVAVGGDQDGAAVTRVCDGTDKQRAQRQSHRPPATAPIVRPIEATLVSGAECKPAGLGIAEGQRGMKALAENSSELW
jgi:hypothetical protein